STVRVFIDHPEGVSLDLCERVTHALPEVREQYALEVSSPGPERPLSKPQHFRRFLGRKARVRTRGDHDEYRSFTGELVGASDDRVVELIVPERLEAHLIVETIDEQTTIDPETGEMVEPQDPEIDLLKFEEYKDQIDEQDVTPEDFGRIAAQTAKQVILQRIR